MDDDEWRTAVDEVEANLTKVEAKKVEAEHKKVADAVAENEEAKKVADAVAENEEAKKVDDEAAKKVEAKKVEAESEKAKKEAKAKMKNILANIPHVGGLNGAQAQNLEKKFVWAFRGAQEFKTDLSTDSTDVVYLDALKAEQYFIELPQPDRGGGDHATGEHLRMSNALLQLLNLSERGSELKLEDNGVLRVFMHSR